MEAIRNLFTSWSPTARYSKDAGRTPTTATTPTINPTLQAYEPKQKEWEDWCARLRGNTDGCRVTEDKLCLFLEQEVINRESRAPGYQGRKTKRKESWKESERAKKRQKTAAAVGATGFEGIPPAAAENESEDEKWDEDALDVLFNETVRYSVVNSYASAITELYAWQQSQTSVDDKIPPLRGAKLSAVLDSVRRDEDRIRRVNFIDRGLFTITGGYDVQGLKNAITWCWETGSKTPGSVESYLRTAAEHLLGHATVTRGKNRRDVQLADLIVIDLENEGPRPGESAPCMIMTMRQGKQNQHGKIEYMGCIRNIDPVVCPLSALAFYFFHRWGRQHTQPFPSFRQPEDYYGHYVFPGSIKVPERPLSYHTQFDWNRRMFRGVGIQSKEKTHSARKQSVRHAELGGVSESHIRRAGRWNTDAMTGVYLSYLPRGFIRSIAGFPQEGKAYFLPRAQETPEEALCRQIWPETDVWLQRMEAYHPDRTDNEVVRLDLAGSGFLRLLRALRVVLLQDSVILRQRFPLHPLWTDPLFDSEEYRRFAARVEDSLVDVVTPDELTMQKFWPAHDAVAKLRHEAAISEIKTSAKESAFEIVRSITDRLDKMERSSVAASFTPSIPPPVPPPAPVWVQQGTTGVWVGSTASIRPSTAGSGSGSIQVPLSELAGHPSASTTQADVGTENSGQSFPSVSPPPNPKEPVVTDRTRADHVSSVYQSSNSPIVLDPQASPRKYKLFRGGNSVYQLWTEWVFGLGGGPSVEALDRCWGARWRTGSEGMFYSRRRRVINDIRRRVGDGTAKDERQAIDQLEQLRGARSLDWLCKNV